MHKIDMAEWYLLVIGNLVDERSAVARRMGTCTNRWELRQAGRKIARLDKSVGETVANALKAGVDEDDITRLTWVDTYGDRIGA